MDSLAMQNPLYSVSRESYGGAAEGSASAEGAGVGISDPGVEPEPSGRAVVGSYTLWRGRKVYELKNHLGNVLAVVSDVKLGQSNSSLVNYYTADVVEMSDYEPFGMLLAKRHWVSGEGYRTDSYRYGFQAQEGDDEWSGEGNMLAFKYRVHDARLGRFLSIDPLAPEYPWNSPYAFSENRVIDSRELEGRELTPAAYCYKGKDDNTKIMLTGEELVSQQSRVQKYIDELDRQSPQIQQYLRNNQIVIPVAFRFSGAKFAKRRDEHGVEYAALGVDDLAHCEIKTSAIDNGKDLKGKSAWTFNYRVNNPGVTPEQAEAEFSKLPVDSRLQIAQNSQPLGVIIRYDLEITLDPDAVEAHGKKQMDQGGTPWQIPEIFRHEVVHAILERLYGYKYDSKTHAAENTGYDSEPAAQKYQSIQKLEIDQMIESEKPK